MNVITFGDDERELLHAVFDASAVGLALVAGEDLRYVKVNPAYRALTAAPEVDPVGRTFAEVWSVPAACLRDLERAASTGGVTRIEDCPVPFGGGTRWFSYHARPLRYAGQPALLLEVTETTSFVLARQSAEAGLDHALRRAAELDAVIDAIADGFVLYGPGGKVLRYNLPAARMVEASGLDPHDAFAMPSPAAVAFTSADGRPLAPEDGPVTRALAGETVVGAHLHVAPAVGEDHWIVVSAAPVRGTDGRVAGAVATFSDETAMHVLEEARDDLVRMISHDLRTPLNAVYTQAHLLRRAPHDPSKVTDRARSIVRSCERMSAMIHDLVDTTLLEAGQLHLSPVPIELEALVPELIERLRGGLDVDRVAVAVAPDLPRVSADPPRLERIVTNLVSNALKYSPGQTPVTLEVVADAGGVRIAVSDRGVGIAPEDQAHLFERYFRARGSRRPEGLGLGLYITRLLVEAHQGRIEVESALGRGSTFRVFLPAAPPESASPA
ncbi:sensor histidine kinase [Anaeromyxobacter oryzae]|uniref:sensor histidine kinase n=1 Tax=Anaeromyxobacter oryzae TaxID=2918170 RepID=UPI0020BE4618|nr:PAS domain-containing sensor histidine kinase [Anaeromyxobacter oryzae]